MGCQHAYFSKGPALYYGGLSDFSHSASSQEPIADNWLGFGTLAVVQYLIGEYQSSDECAQSTRLSASPKTEKKV